MEEIVQQDARASPEVEVVVEIPQRSPSSQLAEREETPPLINTPEPEAPSAQPANLDQQVRSPSWPLSEQEIPATPGLEQEQQLPSAENLSPTQINSTQQTLVPAKRGPPLDQEAQEQEPPAQTRRLTSSSPGPSTRAQSQGKSDAIF